MNTQTNYTQINFMTNQQHTQLRLFSIRHFLFLTDVLRNLTITANNVHTAEAQNIPSIRNK